MTHIEKIPQLPADHERQRLVMAGYVASINERNLVRYADFMHGIRCAFEFIGYKAIHVLRQFTPAEVYQRAIFDLIMENNINLHDYIAQRYDIMFSHPEYNNRGRLIRVKAQFDRPHPKKKPQEKSPELVTVPRSSASGLK